MGSFAKSIGGEVVAESSEKPGTFRYEFSESRKKKTCKRIKFDLPIKPFVS